MPEQRDIVLIPMPFTDLSSQRRRPVIVISNNEYNQKTSDIIVVALTSNLRPADYSFTITSADLQVGTLPVPAACAWTRSTRCPSLLS
jgi:mRNA interferase MazF